MMPFHYKIVIGRNHYYKTLNSEIDDDFNTHDLYHSIKSLMCFYLCFKVSNLTQLYEHALS